MNVHLSIIQPLQSSTRDTNLSSAFSPAYPNDLLEVLGYTKFEFLMTEASQSSRLNVVAKKSNPSTTTPSSSEQRIEYACVFILIFNKLGFCPSLGI